MTMKEIQNINQYHFKLDLESTHRSLSLSKRSATQRSFRHYCQLFTLACSILLTSNITNACEGITVHGTSGASYCLSKQSMNWYSAYAWCDAQGMKLIDIQEVCGSYNSCSELKLSADEQANITNNGGIVDSVWTNTSVKATIAYTIQLLSGNINKHDYWVYNRVGHPYYTLCY